MLRKYFDDQHFDQQTELAPGEYDNCTFSHCTLAGSDLSDHTFLDCTFTDCDLSTVKMNGTGLKTVHFIRCKLLAIHFEDAADFLFRVEFTNCNLELSTFRDWSLKKTIFTDCCLPETDFTGADLTEAVFERCDLDRTIFQRTDLRGADFRTARNYRFSPEDNYLRSALFSFTGLPGLLTEHGIIVE